MREPAFSPAGSRRFGWLASSSFLLGGPFAAHNLVELICLRAAMGAIAGAITGFVLVRLLHNSHTQPLPIQPE